MPDYSKLLPNFEAGTIEAASFKHRDHIGFAYEMLTRYEFLEAVFRYSKSIKQIAANVGADDKFNVTITISFLSIIAERMNFTEYSSFEEFLGENGELLGGGLLPKWYSQERLSSDLARTIFLMPDVQTA